jgi:hypothetical protein
MVISLIAFVAVTACCAVLHAGVRQDQRRPALNGF